MSRKNWPDDGTNTILILCMELLQIKNQFLRHRRGIGGNQEVEGSQGGDTGDVGVLRGDTWFDPPAMAAGELDELLTDRWNAAQCGR